MAIRTLSLFAGCGGLDLSIDLAIEDHRPVCYVENEVTAARILAARFADGSLAPAPVWSDIRSFNGRRWRGCVDLIIGGFPCTDLSVAGKQAGIHGEHSGLWFEYLRIVREVQPRWVFIENVPAVIAHPAGGIVLGGLAECGFDAEWGTLRASDIGAPHQRKRCFILAFRPFRGCGVRGESFGGNEGVAHAEHAGPSRAGAEGGSPAAADDARGSSAVADPSDGLLPQPRRKPEGRDGARPAGADDVADVIGGGLEGRQGVGRDHGCQQSPVERNSLPLFPPGPADRERWAAILREWPWLAPAVEPGVRLFVDDVAVVVDAARADQLRAAGNGVVAIQGAAALILLAQRAGIADELGIGGV